MKIVTLLLSAVLLTSCAIENSKPTDNDLKPRTESENQAITDGWYPIKSEECQLFVDAYGLLGLALKESQEQTLSGNYEGAKESVEIAGSLIFERLSQLALTTSDESIREYATEALPLYQQVSSMFSVDNENFDAQLDFMDKFAQLTGEIPSGCKS
jgi:hypothetical protein